MSTNPQDIAALQTAASGIMDDGMRNGVSAIAYLASDSSVKKLTEALHKDLDAARLETAGAAQQATAERATGKSFDQEMLKAIEDANRNAGSPADKAKLAVAVSGMTGMDLKETEELLNHARVAEQERGMFSKITGSLPTSEKEDYAKLGAALKEKSDDAIAVAAAATRGDSFREDLEKLASGKHESIDAKTKQKLDNTVEAIGGATGAAIGNIALAAPDHAKDIIKAGDRFLDDKSEKNRDALAAAVMSAAEDASRRSGGHDENVVKALTALFGGDKNETRSELHTAAAERAIADRLERGSNENDSRTAAAAHEARGKQQESEAELMGKVKLGLAGGRIDAPAEQPKARTDVQPAVLTTVDPVTPSSPATETPAAETPQAAQHRANGKEKVTELKIEGGGTMKTEELQKALAVDGRNIGTFGANGDGVDGDAGARTAAALLKMRESGAHKGDASLVIHADEVATIEKLAKNFDPKAAHDNAQAFAKAEGAKAHAASGHKHGATPHADGQPAVHADNAAAEPAATKPRTAAETPANEFLKDNEGKLGMMSAENGKAVFHRLTEKEQEELNDRKMLAGVTRNGKALQGGEETKEAVRDYQTKHGIAASGEFDAQTADRLKAELADRTGLMGSVDERASRLAANVPAYSKPTNETAVAEAGPKLSTNAQHELEAAVTGDKSVFEGGLNVRKAVAQYQDSHHIDTERKGTLDAKTMTAMMEDYAKKNHIDLAAVTAKMEEAAATRVAANQTPAKTADYDRHV